MALLGLSGPCARLSPWRFRRVPDAVERSLVDGLKRMDDDRPETVQARVFRVPGDEPTDYPALVVLRGTPPAPDLALLGDAARHVDLVNVYVPYVRQAPGAFSKSS